MTRLTLHEVDQTSNYYKMSGLQVQTSDKAGNRTWNQDESGYSMVLYKIVWLRKWFCSHYISPPSNNLARSTEWPDLQKVSSVSGLIVVSCCFPVFFSILAYEMTSLATGISVPFPRAFAGLDEDPVVFLLCHRCHRMILALLLGPQRVPLSRWRQVSRTQQNIALR